MPVGQSRVAAVGTAQQQAVDFLADRFHQPFEATTAERPIATARPVSKQFLRGPHQVASQTFDLLVVAVNEGLEIPFQMCPAPLQPATLPVHLGPVAGHHAGKGLSQQFADRRGGAAAAEGEDGKGCGHERPQPAFDGAFFGRRFIAVELRLCRDRRDEFGIGWLERLGGDSLMFHGQSRAAGIFSSDVTNSDVRRLLCRKQAINNATKAINCGPELPLGTPAGNTSQVVSPQSGQFSR